MKKLAIIFSILCLVSLIPRLYASTMTVHTTTGNDDYEVNDIINITFDTSSTPPSPATLAVNPNTLDFGIENSQLSFTITNSGTEPLIWSLSLSQNWLSATPTTGQISNSTQTVIINVDRTGLTPTSYSGIINIDSNAGVQTVNVSMIVLANPIINCSPTTLDFGEYSTQSSFTISNLGNGNINWFLNTNFDWISVDQSSGNTTSSSPSIITVTVDRSELFPSNYSGVIAISSNGGNETIDILVEQPQPQEQEPNNSYAQANDLYVNSSLSGNIGYNNDLNDWLLSTFPENGQFYIVLHNTTPGGSSYASVGAVTIYNESLNSIGGVGYSHSGQIIQSNTFSVLSNEDYYIRVEDFPSRQGLYTVEIFFIPSD